MDLLELLKAGKRAVKITTWPGTKNKLGLVVLTEAEIQDAHFAVEELFKRQGVAFSASTVDAYQAEQSTQLLARAIVDPDRKNADGDPARIFSADQLRACLTHPDAKAVLVGEYNDWQNEASPSIEHMTDERYETLFEEVKKNPSALNASNSTTLKGLISYLAVRETRSRTVSGSTS